MTRLALNDLQATKNHISQDKPDAASKIMQRVMEAIEHIVTFPSIGRTGRVPHTKELVVSGTPLIIVYQVKHDTLFIVRIIHFARKWP
jgi:addiction module RelE/StbE family toxin